MCTACLSESHHLLHYTQSGPNLADGKRIFTVVFTDDRHMSDLCKVRNMMVGENMSKTKCTAKLSHNSPTLRGKKYTSET